MIKDTTLNVRTNAKMKARAQKSIEANGMTLSAFINNQLYRAANAKRVTVDFNAEEPSKMLIEDLRESEEDRKAGWTSPAFDNVDDAMEWLNDPNAKYENQIQR